ncbi:MAG: SpoIIE family protein phosphatase [Candidatus Omnitrophota bacterium]
MAVKYLSIRWKLFFAIGTPLLLIHLAVFGIGYYNLRKDAYTDIHGLMTEIATNYAERFDSTFLVAAQTAKTALTFLTIDPDVDERTVYQLLRQNVSQNPFIYGSAAAFEEHEFKADKKLFCPYVHRPETGSKEALKDQSARPAGEDLREIDIGRDAYDYRKADWYRLVKESGKAIWTEPYFDSGAGNVIMCTYSAPFFKEGKFRGVVTVDIRVDDLKQLIQKRGLVDPSAFVITSREGRYISHPQPHFIMKETIFSNAENLGRMELMALGKAMIAGGKGAALIKDFKSSKKIFIFYAPIPSTGWSFAATVPEAMVMGRVWLQLAQVGGILAAGLLLILLLIWILSLRITRPTRELAAFAKEIGDGHFDAPFKRDFDGDEIGDLAESLKKMVRGLKDHMEALTLETAKRQQVESELQVARDIQLSLLPMIFPPFPERKEFDLYAKNGPARFVAGDFFDFFFIDEKTLAFSIADVSGKGIPAAMFMVITRTLLRNIASAGKSPAEVLKDANRILFENNERGMFVTLFLGYYDLHSGKICYVNAGHNQPYFMDRSGTIRKFGKVTGTILGVLSDPQYEDAQEILNPGEMLILYTDGFPEARTPSGEFLNETRFRTLLESYSGESSMDLCEKVFQNAMDFQKQKPVDDLTILALKRLF